MEDTYVRLLNCRLHLFRSSASSFSSQYLLLFLKSSKSCVILLPTPFNSIICPSMASWRRQFLLRIWPIQLAFLRRILLISIKSIDSHKININLMWLYLCRWLYVAELRSLCCHVPSHTLSRLAPDVMYLIAASYATMHVKGGIWRSVTIVEVANW